MQEYDHDLCCRHSRGDEQHRAAEARLRDRDFRRRERLSDFGWHEGFHVRIVGRVDAAADLDEADAAFDAARNAARFAAGGVLPMMP